MQCVYQFNCSTHLERKAELLTKNYVLSQAYQKFN